MRDGFDELNDIGSQSIDSYERYFSEMEALSKEQIEERVDFSEKFEKIILFILSLIVVMVENEQIDRLYVIEQLNTRYRELALQYTGEDDYIDDYINRISTEIADTTLDNSSSDYYTSSNRARFISANEANVILNYVDLQRAVKAGYTHKTWVTMKDERVRHTHSILEGKTIRIGQLFDVGNDIMAFPKDFQYSPSPEETVNCRCSIRYSK